MYHTAPGKFFNEIHVKTFRTIQGEQGIFILLARFDTPAEWQATQRAEIEAG
jgi:DNA-binding cell septation regulator SpoVG